MLLVAFTAACGGDSPVGPTEQPPPDPDPDNDGIPTVSDACPTQAETWNNVFDSDGCPDTSMDLYTAVRADVEAFWSASFTAAGLTYQPISTFQSYTTPSNSPCGALVLNNAFYCGSNMGVYFDRTFLDSYLSSIGDMAPAFIISHEIGHHVSRLLGWVWPRVSKKQAELQADCFGGVWTADAQDRGLLETGDLEEAVTTLIDVGDPNISWFDPNEHGTPVQRVGAFLYGFLHGPSGCTSPDDFLRDIPSPALWFDGVQQYVEVSDHNDLDLGAAFTIEAWIAPTNVQSTQIQHVVSKWNGVGDASYVLMVSSDHFGLATYDAIAGALSAWSSNVISNSAWYHVAATMVGGTVRLYVNGLLDSEHPGHPAPLNSTRPLSFGHEGPPFYGSHYAGLIDEVRVWRIARSQSELSSTMNALLSGAEQGLVGYWRFNEGGGDVAYDLTGRGHDGRLGSTDGPDVNDPIWWPVGAPVPADVADGPPGA